MECRAADISCNPYLGAAIILAAGLEGIRLLSSQTELLVGAGSVLVADQVDQVADAGARFIICPGLSAEVLDQARPGSYRRFRGWRLRPI